MITILIAAVDNLSQAVLNIMKKLEEDEKWQLGAIYRGDDQKPMMIIDRAPDE